MSLIHYSIVGVTASVAAVAGVFLQVTLSQPDTGKKDTHGEEETVEKGVKLPQIAVPIYSQTEKVGYCVMGVEYRAGEVDQEDAELVVPRVTNDLYIEFGSALPASADPVKDCTNRVGKHTDTFVIYEAEFYEKINPEGAGEDES
jgi:hypothetical protein